MCNDCGKPRSYMSHGRCRASARMVEVVPATEAEHFRALLTEFSEHRADSTLGWLDDWSRRVDALMEASHA